MRPANPLASRGVPGIKAPDLVRERKVPNGVEYDSKPDAVPDAREPDTAAGNRGPGGSVDSPQGSASGGFQPVSTGTKRVSPPTTANIDMPAPTMSGACFLAGTVVETQDGLRAIETVEGGQWVAGRNEASGKTTWRRVVQTFRTEDMQALAVDVRHADGEVETIQTTTEHPFYVQDKSWCQARELSAGDRLVLIDNTLSTVVAVEPIAGLHVVYNFEVEVDHTYFVGGRGIWVHNTCRIDWANVRRADGDGNGVSTGRTQSVPSIQPTAVTARSGALGNADGPMPAGPQANVMFDPMAGRAYKRLPTSEAKREFLEDYAKQLRGQEAGINNLTVEKYIDARNSFKANSRNPAAKGAQERFGDNFESEIAGRIYDKLTRKIDPNAPDFDTKASRAEGEAAERAAAIRGRLNALHEPDNVAGGYGHPDPTRMGNARVNQSIGGSWNNGRLSAIDRWAAEAQQAGRGHLNMNVSLNIDTKWGLP